MAYQLLLKLCLILHRCAFGGRGCLYLSLDF